MKVGKIEFTEAEAIQALLDYARMKGTMNIRTSDDWVIIQDEKSKTIEVYIPDGL